MTKTKKPVSIVFSIIVLLIWVGAAVIASQLFVGYIMLRLLGRDTLVEPVPTAIFSVLSYIMAMILIIFVPLKLPDEWQLFKKSHKKEAKKKTAVMGREEIGLEETPTWTDIGLAPIGYFAYLLIAFVLTYLFRFFPWFDAGETQDVGFDTYIVGTDRVVAFLILVVVAPIVEEIIFRGWLYAKVRQKTSLLINDKTSMLVTIFLVSLLFGIIHLQWNVGVNVFALSIVLCALREVTGTIYAGILLHMLKNGIAFFLLYVMGV